MLIVNINFPSFIDVHKFIEMCLRLQYYMTIALNCFCKTYPIFFTNSTGIFQITRPRQSQGAHFKISVGEHVSQAELVVIFFCNRKKKEREVRWEFISQYIASMFTKGKLENCRIKMVIKLGCKEHIFCLPC